MRMPRLLVLAPLALASPASAAGIDLAWDACLGDLGSSSNKVFACDRNTGIETLWATFESPFTGAITGTTGIVEVDIEFHTLSAIPLPVWWDFEDLASCRVGAIDADSTSGTPSCRPWTTSKAPTFVFDRIDFQLPTPDVGRIVVSTRTAGAVVTGQRYLACRLQLYHLRSIGVGACAGCSEPVRITLTAINVAGHIMTQPVTQNFVNWQSGPTATRRTTWGAVKALYH